MSTRHVLNEWFRCPKCSEPAEEGLFRVTFTLGLGNVSLDLSCGSCGFSHTARDWRNQNLRRGIRLRRIFKQAYLTHPLLGSAIHAASMCAACSARGHVEVELERVEKQDGTYVARLSMSCQDCGEHYENQLTHN